MQQAAGKRWEDPKLAEEFQQRQADITAQMDEADQAALELGYPVKDSHGTWQNIYPDVSKSIFEEALSSCRTWPLPPLTRRRSSGHVVC